MKILITGAQTANKGAQSMLFTVMDQFRRRYGEVEIDFIPLDGYAKYASGAYRFDVVCGALPLNRFSRLPMPLKRVLAGAKTWAIRKRQSLSAAELRNPCAAMKEIDALVDISGFSLTSKFPITTNRRVLSYIELAQRMGKRTILLPQSFGPFDYGEHQAEMDEAIPRVLSRVDLLYAREAEGKRMLEEKYGLTHVRLAPDIVLQTGEADWRNVVREEPKLRVPKLEAGSNVGIIPNTKTFKHGDGEAILGCYGRLIEDLLRAGKRVYIFCHSNDLDACQRIYAPFEGREGVALIEREFSCWEYSEFVEQFEFIVASRFHSIVHAYKRGVPALILGWAVKYRELAERFGQTDYVFDITQSYNTDAILAALRKLDENCAAEAEKIRGTLAELREKSCFEDCWKLLDGGAAPSPRTETSEAPVAEKPRNILAIRERGLCSACGVCAANCPKGCIAMEKSGRAVVPAVDEAACVRCGRCLRVCPAGQIDEYEPGADLDRHLLGEHRAILCARAKDEALLTDSTSGGVATQLVRALLDGGDYDSAFLVDGYDYTRPLSTRRFTAADDLAATPGSRYLTVSHEAAARHMIAHPEERIALVATPCAAQALRNTIELNHLNRENYLLIGLFCDKTMNYGVMDYFARHPKSAGRTLRGLRFRTKRIDGWPGDVRLEFADGSNQDLPRTERMQIKEYFMPERCLYCLDKLNRGCDIAVGDNYIPGNEDRRGASSCILRTERGEKLWNKYSARFDWHEDAADALVRAQHLAEKRQNFVNACVKGIYEPSSAMTTAGVRAYRTSLARIAIGKEEDCYAAIQRDLRRRTAKRRLKKLLRKLKLVH